MTDPRPIPEDRLLAWFESALDGADAREVEAGLAADPAARATIAEWERQNAMIGALYDPVADEPVPDRLRAVLSPPTSRRALPPLRRLAASLVLLAAGGAGGWLAATTFEPARGDTVANAAINAYVTYASEVRHPVEVEAAQAAHLTGWLSKRLGEKISAPDFAQHGFHLMGGRLLPGDSGPAAMFMYQNDTGQRITLYVAHSSGQQTAFQFSQVGQARTFWWLDGPLSYAVVGDVPRETLRQIAVAAYDQLA